MAEFKDVLKTTVQVTTEPITLADAKSTIGKKSNTRNTYDAIAGKSAEPYEKYWVKSYIDKDDKWYLAVYGYDCLLKQLVREDLVVDTGELAHLVIVVDERPSQKEDSSADSSQQSPQ